MSGSGREMFLMRRSFGVQRLDLTGEEYDQAGALEAASQVLQKVRKNWNLLDQSGQPRFKLP